MFNAIVIDKVDGNYQAALVAQEESALPEGDVTVAINYSSINCKDALAITGRGPIVRKFPMVPGIDFAGTVIESVNPVYKAGDKVLLTGWGVGEKHWGGLAGKARVSAACLAPLPQGSDARHVMAIGTAGFTAVLCVEAVLNHGVKPEDGPVLVTGASAGVGSCAALILAQLGYQVVASTGRPAEAACGMAQGLDLPASVAPFILRNVILQGIDSVMVSTEKRPALWEKACKYLPMAKLAALTTEYPLAQAIDVAGALLAGKVRGRAVIKC